MNETQCKAKMSNLGVDWTGEPDLDALNLAFALLSRDPEEALVKLKALADRGSTASMLYIAHTYEKLKGDLVQSNDWYLRAMNSGSLLGSYQLARNYYDAKNYVKALDALEFGAVKEYSPSIHMLGVMYLRGFGVRKDIDKARNLFERAAALGHVYAKRNLGILLLRGRYGPRQFFRGLRLCARAVKDVCILSSKDPYGDELR